ncbi:MAG: COX15/CtaA family protein [Planctomycetia bacterium]|nr:COX15/CtaA family protein [Planctomycetia bacterium]
MNQAHFQTDSPWPHRAAVLLVCATFPLIWVGGLVTTYNAGMAVPDWPTTFGYNLFLYPWQTWIAGPWDLFIEHGHRLFGAAVGVLTIALVAAAFRYDRRPWFRAMTLVAVALVIFQGVLGGLRVRLDQRLLAQLHGCTGPAFFALTVALAVWTSRRWRDGVDHSPAAAGDRSAARFQRLAWLTTALACVQLVLGSQLRHVRVEVDASVFRAAVWLHLFMAAALTIHVALVAARSLRFWNTAGWLARPAVCLGALLLVQLGLGGGAWVVNYGWPAGWFGQQAWAQGFVVAQESSTQAIVTTAHVATGSLILATALLVALRSMLLPASRPLGTAARFARQEALA